MRRWQQDDEDNVRVADKRLVVLFGHFAELLVTASGSTGMAVLEQLLQPWQSVVASKAAAAGASSTTTAMANAPPSTRTAAVAAAAAAHQSIADAIIKQPKQASQYLGALLSVVMKAWGSARDAQDDLSRLQRTLKQLQLRTSAQGLLATMGAADIRSAKLQLECCTAIAARLPALQQCIRGVCFGAAMQWQLAHAWRLSQLKIGSTGKQPQYDVIDAELLRWLQWLSQWLHAAAHAAGAVTGNEGQAGKQQLAAAADAGDAVKVQLACEQALQQLFILADAGRSLPAGSATAAASGGASGCARGSDKPAVADPVDFAAAFSAAQVWWLVDRKRRQPQHLDVQTSIKVSYCRWQHAPSASAHPLFIIAMSARRGQCWCQ